MKTNPATKESTVPQNPLGVDKITRLLPRFAIPSIISMVVNSLYNIVDQIFIGHIGEDVGYLGNAATNVAFPLVTIAMAIALLIADGSAAFYSLKLGERDSDGAARGAGSAITLAAVTGFVFMLAGLLFLKPLLLLFGATPGVMPYALEYTRIILFGLPFVILGITLNSLIRADGNPRFAMISMLTGAVINTVLDPLLIFGFGMGIRGAAIATILGQIVSFCISACYLPRFHMVKMNRRRLRPDGKATRTLLSFGTSSFINQLALTLVVIVMNNSLSHYGAMTEYGSDIPLSALGIVMKVNQILMSVIIGLSVGAQPIMGYNYGARQWSRVKKTYLLAVGVAVAVSCVGFVMFQFFPQIIIALFGQANEQYNRFAESCFRIYLLMCIPNAFQMVSSIFFQAIGKPVKATILSLSRQVVFAVPLMLLLPLRFGLFGVLYAGPVTDTLAFVLAAVLIVLELRGLNRKIREELPRNV